LQRKEVSSGKGVKKWAHMMPMDARVRACARAHIRLPCLHFLEGPNWCQQDLGGKFE